MATPFSTAVEGFRSHPIPNNFHRSKRRILKGAFDEAVERIFSKGRGYEKMEEGNEEHADFKANTSTQPATNKPAFPQEVFFADRRYPTPAELRQKYPNQPTEEQVQSILMEIRDEAEEQKQRERGLTGKQVAQARKDEEEKYAHLKVEEMDEELLKRCEVNPFRFLGLVVILFGDSCTPGVSSPKDLRARIQVCAQLTRGFFLEKKNYCTGDWHLKAPRKLTEEEKEWCSERLSSVIQIPEVAGSWERRNPNECYYERKWGLILNQGGEGDKRN